MKKLLLCVTALAMLAGCAKKTNTEEIMAGIETHKGACADVAFKDTKVKLEEVQKLNDAGKTEEANQALITAQDLYNAGVVRYNDLEASVNKSSANVNDQKSRVAAVEVKARNASPKEAEGIISRINALHADAEMKIKECNVLGAEVAVAAAEKEVRKLEALAGGAAVQTSAYYTVKKGDCLWNIAKDQYANPYFWPLIYWANKADIKDPDLIYPNQKFVIDSANDADAKAQAEKFAKTRGAWSVYDNK